MQLTRPSGAWSCGADVRCSGLAGAGFCTSRIRAIAGLFALSAPDAGWFAGMVMEWDERADDDRVVFNAQARVDVEDLMLRLLDASPTNRHILNRLPVRR